MIDAVLAFGAMNVLFELVLLSLLSPRRRLRVLGSPTMCGVIHLTFLVLNVCIHWGTLIGTMSSILAFVCSIGSVWAAQKLWGTVRDERFYTTGLIRYSAKELT
jgi:hypothetical protein